MKGEENKREEVMVDRKLPYQINKNVTHANHNKTHLRITHIQVNQTINSFFHFLSCNSKTKFLYFAASSSHPVAGMKWKNTEWRKQIPIKTKWR